jgi:hypothetical protein
VVEPSFYILRFETTSGPQPGGEEVKVYPEDAFRICQNQVANRLRTVPMEYITVERAKDSADGSYVINWREQRPGWCWAVRLLHIASDRKMRKFRFDTPPAQPAGSALPSYPAH